MFNKDVFEKMSEKFGKERMPLICEIMEYMFHLGDEDTKKRGLSSDFSHDRDWWKAKYEEILK